MAAWLDDVAGIKPWLAHISQSIPYSINNWHTLEKGATVKKALKRFNLTEDRTGFPWHTLACDRGLWKSLICPDSFYNRVSRSDIAEKVNNPHTHTTPANNGSIDQIPKIP